MLPPAPIPKIFYNLLPISTISYYNLLRSSTNLNLILQSVTIYLNLLPPPTGCSQLLSCTICQNLLRSSTIFSAIFKHLLPSAAVFYHIIKSALIFCHLLISSLPSSMIECFILFHLLPFLVFYQMLPFATFFYHILKTASFLSSTIVSITVYHLLSSLLSSTISQSL